MEYLSPEGLRQDGRRPQELRRVSCDIGVVKLADGSSRFQIGNTIVICSVYGPREVTHKSNLLNSGAKICCDYIMTAFSTKEHRSRTRGDRRSLEYASWIEQIFTKAVMVELMPRTQIDVVVQVIQADGGVRSAAINAVTIALIDAGIPMNDYVCSCSSGYVNESTIIDLNLAESSSNMPEATIALFPRTQNIVGAQMENRLNVLHFKQLLSVAIDGAMQIHNILDVKIKDYINARSMMRGNF